MHPFRGRRRPIPRLPCEICEIIIGFVGSSPLDTTWNRDQRRMILLSCLLVCRRWVPKSRIYLYEDVKLTSKRKAISFMEAITHNPFLGQYVRYLMINPNFQHDDWIYTAHRVLPQHLPNLHHLEYHEIPAVHPLFFAIAARFNFVKSLVLENLDPWSLQEITRLLNRFPRLEKLAIFRRNRDTRTPRFGSLYCRNIGENALNPITMVMDIQIADLFGNCNGSLFQWLTRSHRYHSLRVLSLSWDDLSPVTSPSYLNNFLLQCAGSLRFIRLVLPSADGPISRTACEWHLCDGILGLMHI